MEGEDRGPFSHDLGLRIFQNKVSRVPQGSWKSQPREGQPWKTKLPRGLGWGPRAGGRGVLSGVQLLLSSRTNTRAPNLHDLWFTSALLIKRKHPTPPGPGLPIRGGFKATGFVAGVASINPEAGAADFLKS